jgi:hypothetical protein
MDHAALRTLIRLAVQAQPELRDLLSTRALASLEPMPNVFEPLYRDTVARVIKREMNDLRGAVRRNLAKGEVEPFERWCAEFYQTEQPGFVQRAFQPLLAAQRQAGTEAKQAVEVVFLAYFEKRRAETSGKTAEELEKSIDAWAEHAPNQVVEEILQAIAE